jgi:large subunit ribosomal protein L21
MYAVIQTGGKQYRVEKGETLTIEKLPAKAGEEYLFNEVLLVAENGKVKIGTPTVPKASVVGKVLRQAKEKKIVVFKFKRRKNYRRTQGHRQQVSVVKIEEIKIG